MNMIDFYYYNLGEEPSEIQRSITESTLNHLLDNGYSEKEIMCMFKDFPLTPALTPEDLPECLWEDSLLNKGTFYYHKELHIISKAPYWDLENDRIVSPKFFLEMKINFNVKDIINYFYKNFKKDESFKDSKKDIGTINYLLERYSKNPLISPIDFILFLIDEAAYSQIEIDEIIELKQFESNNLKELNKKVLNATAERLNRIVWR